jgi:hypothetical protein
VRAQQRVGFPDLLDQLAPLLGRDPAGLGLGDLDHLAPGHVCGFGIRPLEPLAALNAAEKATQSNGIVILADDLACSDLSTYGNRQIETPRLDQLAAGGAKFLNGYVSGCTCSPTRAALMTSRKIRGHHPAQDGVPVFPVRTLIAAMVLAAPSLDSFIKFKFLDKNLAKI